MDLNVRLKAAWSENPLSIAIAESTFDVSTRSAFARSIRLKMRY
jgi:hypothetical protein